MKNFIKSILIMAIVFASNVGYSQYRVSPWQIEFLAINSLSDDFSTSFYRDGLIFTSNRNPGFAVKYVDNYFQKPFTSLYIVDDYVNLKVIAQKDLNRFNQANVSPNYSSNSVSDSKVLGQYDSQRSTDTAAIKAEDLSGLRLAGPFLQTKYHDGPAYHSGITNDFYVTRNNYYEGKEKRGIDRNNKLQIYIIRDFGGQNFDVRKFPHNSDDYNTMHPALTLDGQIIIYASDKKGGYGGLDLYYCVKEGDTWSKAQNMGPKVNTEKDDAFPYIDPQGNLYYSSNGLEGAGNLDVYYLRLDKTEVISSPRNMGTPINTQFDDFGFIFKDNIGFVSSNRLGNDDIYKVKYNPQK